MKLSKLITELSNTLDGLADMNARLRAAKHPLADAYEAIYSGLSEFELELAEALDIPSRRDHEDARAIDALTYDRWSRT